MFKKLFFNYFDKIQSLIFNIYYLKLHRAMTMKNIQQNKTEAAKDSVPKIEDLNLRDKDNVKLVQTLLFRFS